MRKKTYLERFGRLFLLLCIILHLLFLSCTSVKTVQNKHTSINNDSISNITTNNKQTIIHDSVYYHDSTYVFMRGDTTYIDRWHIKTIYKDRYIEFKDTVIKYIERSRTDTIQNIKKIQKTKAKNLGISQQISIFALSFVVIFIIYYVLIRRS